MLQTNQTFFTFIFIIFSVTLLLCLILSNNNDNVLFFFFNYDFHNFKAFAQYSIAPTSPSGPTVNDPNLKVQIVFPTSGKGNTSMAFLAPNDILVLEKNTGKIDRIVNGKMLPNSVLDVAVANYIERGLLGIAIAPTLSPDGKRYVYLYYTQAGNGITTDGDEFLGLAPPKGNMVYRFEWTNNQLLIQHY